MTNVIQLVTDLIKKCSPAEENTNPNQDIILPTLILGIIDIFNVVIIRANPPNMVQP